jgi:hypothetical protein
MHYHSSGLLVLLSAASLDAVVLLLLQAFTCWDDMWTSCKQLGCAVEGGKCCCMGYAGYACGCRLDHQMLQVPLLLH